MLAAYLAVGVPGVSQGKTVVAAALLLLSVVPVVVGFILLSSPNTGAAANSANATTRDPLTNLYNQMTFWDFLGYEIERAKRQDYRFSVLLADIDNFKTYNDLHGHEAGDAFLVEFASIFKAAIRKGDIAARYSGDGFVAILPVCDEAQAYIAAQRLLNGLHEHAATLPPDRVGTPSSVSIGLAVYPDHGTNAQDLFSLADNMLHQAKQSGKGRASCPSEAEDSGVLKSVGEKSLLIMDAIRKKRIVPYYQPIFSVKDQSILAHEVLTRIVTPERIIPAAEFIEAAEGMGAIGKIDNMLIEQAFKDITQNGYTGKLFFNLSPKALVMNEFLTTMRKNMRSYGIVPSQLVFEITERDTVKNTGAIEKIIRELKREGFQFAIDDFGSGYSSLHYIKLFMVDFLKVDGEFIRNMTGDNTMEQLIVANIADLAGHLGIKTIAEFVESASILNNVRSAGIEFAQGYHLCRPQPHLSA